MSGSWSNTATELVIIQASAGGFTGFFVYSPTIGAGDLIASVAGQDGTDPYGDAYYAGVASYTAQTFALLRGGQLFVGDMPATAQNLSNAAALFTTNGSNSVSLLSKLTGAAVSRLLLELVSATASNRARFLVLNQDSTDPADLLVSGAALAVSADGGTPESWQTPSFSTGWSATSTWVAGITDMLPLQFRRNLFDQVELTGGFTYAGGGTTTILVLPAGYVPKKSQFVTAQRNRSGTITNGFVLVDANSQTIVNTSSSFGAPAAGDVYYCNGAYELGNIS